MPDSLIRDVEISSVLSDRLDGIKYQQFEVVLYYIPSICHRMRIGVIEYLQAD
jgi:hypothetical protein